MEWSTILRPKNVEEAVSKLASLRDNDGFQLVLGIQRPLCARTTVRFNFVEGVANGSI